MYQATVSPIQALAPHPNADKIQLATVLGEQVVVGLDTKVGDLGIYFPVDDQLSHEFCIEQKLYSKSAQIQLGLELNGSGFFDHNRRVRTQKFRGQKSEGFWIPTTPQFLASTGLTSGTSFTSINGFEV